MGFVLSYRAGAWKMIRAVPMRQAHVNIHRNSLSKTMATYCQSSMICGRKNNKTLVYSCISERIIGSAK